MDPDVPPNLCFPGKAPVAEAVAQITGKQMGAMEDLVAVVHCARSIRKEYKKYDYVGYGLCSGANLAFAGPTDCQYGCVGFGECAGACLFHAITMEADFPVINPNLCVGCGVCVRTCPKGLISLVPKNARAVVRCSSKDTGKVTHQICAAGCLHCMSCVRACPAEAVALVDGVIRIDHKACLDYGPQCNDACIKACFMVHAIQPYCERPLFQKEDTGEPTAQEALAL
jgi:Na+-translocating ferredoxin:NAD+ oxidoreductase subunit B